MFSNEEGKFIARLIVAGASIDGTLNSKERDQLSSVLIGLGHSDLIAEVGFALDNDFGDFDIFQDTKLLLEKLGSRTKELSPIIFTIIAACVTSDRFISSQEASFLSALARRLKLSTVIAGNILKKIIENNKGKLEVGGEQIDALVHPHLKELLSFTGANELVGEIKEDSLEERIYQAQAELDKTKEYSHAEIQQALLDLGLNSSSTIEDAKEVWQKTLHSINLGQLSEQGEVFVSAALTKVSNINAAYCLLNAVDKTLHLTQSKKNEIEILESKLSREVKHREKSLGNELENEFSKVKAA